MSIQKLLVTFEFRNTPIKLEIINDTEISYTRDKFYHNDTIWDFFILNSPYYKKLYGDYQVGLTTYPNDTDHHYFTSKVKNIEIVEIVDQDLDKNK